MNTIDSDPWQMAGVELLASSPRTSFKTLEHQRLRAATLCLALKQRFAELYARDFPDDGATKALGILGELLSIVQRRIELIADEQTLVMTSDVIILLGETLEYFDNAGTDQTPRGLVSLLQALYSALKRPSNILAWPQANYNFTIRSLVDFLRELFQNLGPDAEIDAVFKAYTGPHHLVSFPRIERDNVRMYAVFGHELGHKIADEYLLHERGTSEYQTQEASVRTAVISAMGGAPQLGDLQRKLASVLTLRMRALEELISDTVGVYLFGPSALFAAHEVHAGAGMDVVPSDENDGYPPGRMRLRVSLDVSRSESHLDALSEFESDPKVGKIFSSGVALIDRIADLSASDNDINAISADTFAKIAYDWVASTLPAAQAFAKAKIGDAIYTQEIQRRDCPKLVERLLDGLPPNEIGSSLNPQQVDVRSPVLASWLIALNASQKASSAALPMDLLGKLNERTLRGIEYVVLQRDYRARHAGA